MAKLLDIARAATIIAFAFGCAGAGGCTQQSVQPETEEPDVQTSAVETTDSDTSFDYESYIGAWCDEENATSSIISSRGIKQLDIISLDSDEVVFNVLKTMSAPAYRMTGNIEAVVGVVKDDKATFTFKDDRGGINEGSIKFQEDAIFVHIETIGSYDDSLQGPGGSVSMDCRMVRDQFKGNRQAAAYDASYIFPDSNTRLLTDDDVQFETLETLELGRNEIYARHGYEFSDPDIAAYFQNKAWYEPTTPGSSFDASVFNEIERENIALIQEWEALVKSHSGNTSFIGTSGTYRNGSTPSDNPSLVISFNEDDSLIIDITGTYNDKVYYSNLSGTITSDTEAVASVEGAKLLLTWSSPGVVSVSCREGAVPESISNITNNPSYANKDYLHIS